MQLWRVNVGIVEIGDAVYACMPSLAQEAVREPAKR